MRATERIPKYTPSCHDFYEPGPKGDVVCRNALIGCENFVYKKGWTTLAKVTTLCKDIQGTVQHGMANAEESEVDLHLDDIQNELDELSSTKD